VLGGKIVLANTLHTTICIGNQALRGKGSIALNANTICLLIAFVAGRAQGGVVLKTMLDMGVAVAVVQVIAMSTVIACEAMGV
jgi:hypothetical protein